EGAHIDEELGQKRNIFAGLFKQHRHLRHQVSHEQKDEPKTQEKNHRRINEWGYDLFLEIVDGHQKSRLPLQQLGQRTTDFAGRNQIAVKISEAGGNQV